jgi:methyl-accepting chemotaxis protein
MKLTTKLILAILVAGLIPAALISRVALKTADAFAQGSGELYLDIAQAVSSRIDRTMFERYGDAQAFASNGGLLDVESWYLTDSAKNRVSQCANRSVELYSGMYSLVWMVDTSGRVVGVNDRNSEGKPIDTKFLYSKNYAATAWFKEAMAGNFTKGPGASGTFMEDVQVDEDVRQALGGDGLVMTYSAPVKDLSGKVIGVWHNCADFSLVEEIITSSHKLLAARGLEDSEITLVDRAGRVLVEYDPKRDGRESVLRNMNVILKTNLAATGNPAVREVNQGRSGHMLLENSFKKVQQVCGYSPCVGALGAPTFKWGAIVGIASDRALSIVNEHREHVVWVMAWSALGLLVVAWLLGQALARSLTRGIHALEGLSGSLVEASRQFSTSSQTVAEGASEQAAALEETSASLEEIAAMTHRTSENADHGKQLSHKARNSASVGLDRIAEMSRTLTAIRDAVHDMEAAVNEMQSSSQEVANIINTIDEIAFQTNLLALNAAVEAARAGEAGMGFAVVADEVRALAQLSAQAAKETAEKIDSSLRRSAQSGVASAKVVSSLGEVESTAGSLQTVFEGIVTQVGLLDDVINEMAVACSEQTTGIGQVNLAVSQMDSVTQANASVAEGNAAGASDLNRYVGSLQETVSDLREVVRGRRTAISEDAPAEPKAARGPASQWRPSGFKANGAIPSHGSVNPGVHHSARESEVPSKSLNDSIPMPEEDEHPRSSASVAGSFKDF